MAQEWLKGVGLMPYISIILVEPCIEPPFPISGGGHTQSLGYGLGAADDVDLFIEVCCTRCAAEVAWQATSATWTLTGPIRRTSKGALALEERPPPHKPDAVSGQ